MGRTSGKSKIRGSVISQEVALQSQTKTIDYESIPKESIPYVDENKIFHWNANEKDKEKYFPSLYAHQKQKIENLFQKVMAKHSDRNYLVENDVNNYIRARMWESGVFISGKDYKIPNPNFDEKDYNDLLLKNKENIMNAFTRATPDSMYKYMYGMARGRMKLDEKMKLLSGGKRVPVTDYDGNKTAWKYNDRYSMYKPVINRNDNKTYKAVIMPNNASQIKNASTEGKKNDNYQMKVAITNKTGTKIFWQKTLHTFNTNSNGAHAALVKDAEPELAFAGYL